MQTRTYPTSGFTLIEIILVVVIVGILAAMAIPNFSGHGRNTHSIQQNACINNLRQIDGAKDQWALENGKKPMDPINQTEVNKYIKHGEPSCPAKGIYTYGVVGTNPTCTLRTLRVGMHVLP